MKLKEGLIINKIDEDYFLIDLGVAEPAFKGMIKLNKTSKDIVTLLKEERDLEDIISSLNSEYDVKEKTLRKDVIKIINVLKENRLFEE